MAATASLPRQLTSVAAWTTLLFILCGIFLPDTHFAVALVLSLVVSTLLHATVGTSYANLREHRHITKAAGFATILLVAATVTAFGIEVHSARPALRFIIQPGWVRYSFDEFDCIGREPQARTQDAAAQNRTEVLLNAVSTLDHSRTTMEPDDGAVQAIRKAYLALGDLYMADCRFSEAQTAYEHASGLGDESGVASWRLANLHTTAGVVKPSTQPRTRQTLAAAAAYYRLAAQKLAHSQGFLNDMVEAQVVLNRYQLQTNPELKPWLDAAYATLIESSPEDIQRQWQWATALYRLGYMDDAEQVYRRVIAAEPKRADAWFLLAQLYERTGKADEAIGAYRLAIELEPNRRPAYLALAQLYVEQGRYDLRSTMYAEATVRLRHSAWLQQEYARTVLEDFLRNEMGL